MAEDKIEDNIAFDVIIVGAGVAGCSAAFHLHKAAAGFCTIRILLLDAAEEAGEGIAPRQSGSATMHKEVAPCSKMMVQIFAGRCQDMIRHHGTKGAARYLRATKEGLIIQKTIGKDLWQDRVGQHLKELGSYYVGYSHDEKDLKSELDLLKSMGCDDIEWCDEQRLQQVHGLMSNQFTCGIYFPKDAIIDSSLYAKSIIKDLLRNGNSTEFLSNSTVTDVRETKHGVKITLTTGKSYHSKHVVISTGAFFRDSRLHGLIQPCYSYLVHVPINTTAVQEQDNSDDEFCSPNFFTWGFSHDWCFTNGKVRVSGEDHFSAYKPAFAKERCHRLSQWTLEQYGCCLANNETTSTFSQQYGLYSETPDMIPLVGGINHGSRVCYLLGCNAWGQTILSYCASLVPGMLGYSMLTEAQRDILELVSIQRFTELPESSTL